ncbi:phytanoyl-CoA dioxygenase family protein [Sphingomonas sp. SRS2]|uniref:phytanoyl-CoA dioxygenase family protein n=1 Tax=Sphingomonas sp. SRS2 TaxID=133190 RepID=UPI000618464E|nr:phytanoyl-CoA dioxygenase family protein [Sphingomonas sp. SRS2]KKC27299.1 phytanoyl-CoA dioxygenase [Sphingomonas sp. SRS2]
MSDLSERFALDGAVVLRNILDGDQVAMLRKGIDANLAAPSHRVKTASGPEDPGRFVEDFRNWQRIPEYRELIFSSRLAEAAADLMQSSTARLHHDHMLTKEAGTLQRTPWHQDQPYYNIDGRQNVSFWIPADPIPREATLEFVAESHLGPWLMPRSFMAKQANWFPEGTLADLPDIEADRARHRILGWALEPGDAVAFHMLTLHSSAGSARRRRVFSVRFVGDDARHAPREWATSPDFPELAERLPAGAAFDDPLFPVAWTEGGMPQGQ